MGQEVFSNPNTVIIAGGLTQKQDGLNQGVVSLDGGLITSNGAGLLAAVNVAGKQSAAAATIANAGTIATANLGVSRVTDAGAVTGVIMQAGTVAGQQCLVVCEQAAANTITMAAAGTSNVAAGVTCILSGLAAHLFVWDSGTSLWYQTGPAAN